MDQLIAIASAVGIVGTAAAFIVGFIRHGPSYFQVLWQKTPLGLRLAGYKALRQLRPNVQLSYFKERLGNPLVRNRAGELDQYFFVKRLFYVQVIVDENEQVVLYSVTSRDQRFKPRVWPNNMTAEDHPARLLGLHDASFTRFGGGGIRSIQLFVRGATRPTHYVEERNPGNPGFYETFLLGLNECGYFNFDPDTLFPFLGPEIILGKKSEYRKLSQMMKAENELREWLESTEVAYFRSTARPNVYGVTAQNFRLEDKRLDFYLGPHPVDARTWPEEERSLLVRSVRRLKRAWAERQQRKVE